MCVCVCVCVCVCACQRVGTACVVAGMAMVPSQDAAEVERVDLMSDIGGGVRTAHSTDDTAVIMIRRSRFSIFVSCFAGLL